MLSRLFNNVYPGGLLANINPEFDQNYNTILSPEEEQQFKVWKQQYAPNDSGYDYDLRGAFKSGFKPDPTTGHWDDTFKKPNHPTFSTFSKYAKYAPNLAGSWNGENYIPNLYSNSRLNIPFLGEN
jgi:hypothetical protein